MAVERLRKWQQEGDYEMAHSEADAIICELLRTLGYDDVVEEWHKVGKWYA